MFELLAGRPDIEVLTFTDNFWAAETSLAMPLPMGDATPAHGRLDFQHMTDNSFGDEKSRVHADPQGAEIAWLAIHRDCAWRHLTPSSSQIGPTKKAGEMSRRWNGTFTLPVSDSSGEQ